jgi:hypothetical protein
LRNHEEIIDGAHVERVSTRLNRSTAQHLDGLQQQRHVRDLVIADLLEQRK